MVVHLTGSWRSPVKLVCRLQAGELPPEAGQHVDGIRLVGCESWPSSTLSETLLLIHGMWVMRELPSLGHCGA